MNKILKETMVVLKLIGESTVFAFSSLKNDLFRTFLSLLGVCIGIFSIVAVFCAVDALKDNVHKGLSSFGGDVILIQEYPWGLEEGEGEYKWWEYRQRPAICRDDYTFLYKNSKTASTVAYFAYYYKLFTYNRNSFSNGYVIAATHGFENVMKIEIESGRLFSSMENTKGSNVVILGAEVASALFLGENPVGKSVKVGSFTSVVVGVLKKQGQSIVQVFDFDNSVIVPLAYGAMMSDVYHDGGMVMMAPKDGVSQDDFIGETKLLMRSERRLKPSQKDNFSINKMTFLTNQMDSVFKVINMAGWVIGGFSLLIGGFGIANIMFVSVKERTNQIGIQKALGAKRYVIMTQFLVEAAVLSIAGGLLGILMVWVASFFMKDNPSFPVVMSVQNAAAGLLIALVIGIISGIIPAYAAAKLDPVKAINA